MTETDEYLQLLKKCLAASLYDESAWCVLHGPMRQDVTVRKPMSFVSAKAKHGLLSFLRRRNLMLVRCAQFDPSLREQGLDWPCFGYTMVGLRRLNNVQACVDDVLTHNVPGDLVETGVWRGGSAMLMRAVLQRHGIRDRKVWCCDSFEGMPVPGEADKKVASNADFSDRDYLCVSLDQVKENFHRFELLDDQVEFIKGWFCDTLPDAPIEVIAVLRLDGDLYASTMDSLHNLYPKVAPGGYVIVDDYNSWAGCHQAVDDYRKQHEISAELLEIDPHAVYWQVPY